MSGARPKALWRAWHAAAPSGLTEKRFFDWLPLQHAVQLKTPERNWDSIADELQTDVDTLARIAKRLVDLHLSELSVAAIELLRDQFRFAVLTPLGIRTPWNRLR